MPSINETISKTKCICDVCKCVVWCETYTSPKGWGTSRDDHDNLFCPDCNPWYKHLDEPDPIKLKIVEDKYVPYYNIQKNYDL